MFSAVVRGRPLGLAMGLNDVLCSTAGTCVCQGLRRDRNDILE